LLGQSTSFSNGHAVYDNKQRLGLDAGAGEAVTGEYALVINGHSLVSLPEAVLLFFFTPAIISFVLP
jgi:phospholipid-translocating ATPase